MFVKSLVSLLSKPGYLHQSPLSPGLSSVLLHTSSGCNSALATLRKNTGYSLSICKKALGENNNDVGAAEKWLKDQAQAQGWAKAQKLQGRNTSQGLLGVLVRSQTAAMVEVNCETDFVARNTQFIGLLKQVAESCVNNNSSVSDQPITKTVISRDSVAASASVEEGKTVGDLVALNIGQIGENMALGQARLFSAGPGVRLAAQCHPSAGAGGDQGWFCGRYAAVLAYTVSGHGSYPVGVSEEVFIKQLCQHIVGMGPTSLDDADDKENSLLHQSFLLDEDKRVSEVLGSAGVEVVDFTRVEVGRSEE